MKNKNTNSLKNALKRPASKRAVVSLPAVVTGKGKRGPRATNMVVKGKSGVVAKAKTQGGFGDTIINVYPSSEARAKWSEVKDKALSGESVVILAGQGRVLQVREIGVSYAELEYGVTSKQIHERSRKNKSEIKEEIRIGKVRRIV